MKNKLLNQRMLTLNELAVYLKIHPQTVYRHTLAGKIPHFRLGSLYRYNADEVVAALEKRSRRRGTD